MRRTGEQNRQAVIAAACRHIESSGALSLRVNRLVEDTGVAEAMIYRYFGDRTGIIAAACHELWLRYAQESYTDAQRLLALIDEIEITPDVIADVMLLPRAGDNEARRRLRVQILAASMEIPELRAAISEAQRRQDEITEQLICAVTARIGAYPISARMQRVMFSALAFGYAVDDLHGDDAITDDEVRTFWHEFFRRFAAPQAPSPAATQSAYTTKK